MGPVMLNDPVVLSLVSGLAGSVIGAVVGAYAAFRFYRRDRYDSARLILIARLETLLDETHFSQKVFTQDRWAASMKPMTRSYHTLEYFAPCRMRRRIRRVWENYIGQDRDTEEKAKRAGTILHTKVPPMYKEQLEKRIHDFLEVLK